MRLIVKEQPYEKPIASGQFRYEREGQATGTVETWRLSQATAEYEMLRVDLDARSASSGHSYLYHLVRQTNGRPERFAYRFWGDGLDIEGTLLFSETEVTGTRTVNGRTFNEDLDIEAGTGFWFPAAVGLGLAVKLGSGLALTLNNLVGEVEWLALRQIEMQLKVKEAGTVQVLVAGQEIIATTWQIQWQNQSRLLQVDEHGWPLKMERDDGLTAVETRYIWY